MVLLVVTVERVHHGPFQVLLYVTAVAVAVLVLVLAAVQLVVAVAVVLGAVPLMG